MQSVLKTVWLGGVVVTALDSPSRACWFNSRPFHCGNNSRQVVDMHVPLSPSRIILYQPRREGIASLAQSTGSLSPGSLTMLFVQHGAITVLAAVRK